MTTRRGRGAATEHLVAEHWRTHGWPHAEVRRGNGTDLTGTPGIAVEIKARRDFLATLWLKQASSRPGLPVCIWRPDGYGLTRIEEWPTMMYHRDLIALLHAAGYGTPPDATDQPPRLPDPGICHRCGRLASDHTHGIFRTRPTDE
jgi:hypothetical protein